MGRLQSLIDDSEIENIDINGCDRVWASYADGSKRLMAPIADSDQEVVDIVRSVASRFGLSERRFDMACRNSTCASRTVAGCLWCGRHLKAGRVDPPAPIV